jgi:uncharacterized protein (DUF58 family)
LLDATASMRFGTQDRTKSDVAEGLVLAISHLATGGANRLGVVVLDDVGVRVQVPPTANRRMILRALASSRDASRSSAPPADGRFNPATGPSAREASLADAFVIVGRVARRAGAIVAVSDLRDAGEWRSPLARLALRHHVLVLEVLDERAQDLPDVGELHLIDPETGRQLRVDTSDRALRERFHAAAAAEREHVRRLVTSTGAHHVVATTRGDWLRPLASFLSKRRRPAR